MGRKFTYPIPIASRKQPKQKNQTFPQLKDGMGQLCKDPSQQRKKNQTNNPAYENIIETQANKKDLSGLNISIQ